MRMSAYIASALSLATVAALAHAEVNSKPESSHQILHFAGPGPHVLEVRTISGVINVEGYDGTVVDMTVQKSIGARDAETLQQAQTEVVLETADNAATIGAIARYPYHATCGEDSGHNNRDWPHYEVRYDFTIRVPRDTKLVLCTVNHGEVTVNGVRADFNVSSVNGRIEMNDMGGSGEATTVNGGVVASFVAAPRNDSLFKTVNGGVVLQMPDTFTADLNMKSFTGGLYTDFDSKPRAVQTVATPQRKDGKFVYETNAFATVRIGNGGPLLTLETLNGDVRVLRRAR